MKSAINWSSAILAGLLIGAFALLSIRGIVDPTGGAASFGVRATEFESQFYHAVYRSRNLAIALMGLAFLIAGMWRALAIALTVAIALPVFDILALVQSGRPVAAVHPATLVGLVLSAGLLWTRVAIQKLRS